MGQRVVRIVTFGGTIALASREIVTLSSNPSMTILCLLVVIYIAIATFMEIKLYVKDEDNQRHN